MSVEIRDAVRMALFEEKLKDHEERIVGLEKFKWALLTGTLLAACSSAGSLLVLILERVH